MLRVSAYNKERALIAEYLFDDLVGADGAAAGLHERYKCDVFVNQALVFSQKQLGKRLAPGVLDGRNSY